MFAWFDQCDVHYTLVGYYGAFRVSGVAVDNARVYALVVANAAWYSNVQLVCGYAWQEYTC